VEPEEVEAVLKKFNVAVDNGPDADAEGGMASALGTAATRPALKEVAVVASPEPSELVAFASRRDGIPEAEVTVEALRRHCQERLTPSYVPKFFVVLDDFPHLPNGKVNLADLKQQAVRHVNQEGEVVMDSLGQMKKLSKDAVYENAVIHRCYAYWMIGVLFDHYFRCALDTDQFGNFIPFCTVLATPGVKPWSEVLIRSFGNDQDLFGFILLGAYQDSRPAKEGEGPKVKLGLKDLFLFAVYLMLALPFAQFFYFVFGGSSGLAWPQYWGETCQTWATPEQNECLLYTVNSAPDSLWNWDYMQLNSYTSDHRWYLIMVCKRVCTCRFARYFAVQAGLQV
jgi:hypothetical protein